EVADLCGLLRCMGAEVEVRPDRIIVRGRRELRGCEYRIIPDRIEAGTYLLAGAITRGRVRVEGAVPEHMDALIALLEESGLEVSRGEGGVEVDARGRSWVGIEVETAPYPGFPTDLQPPLTAFLTLAQGKSILRETVFESRFGHVGELLRMGARIGVHDRTISVQGVAELKGADLRATDIRAGAALVLAALAAQGTSRISGVEHIRRGYENILGKLALLGAEVWEEESAT
ncbi:MAG TPA: UDP-N-acetylglucosamine 1-carboxyvinyltransferase, partial [Candidatus Acetothermia bacterium]|nr:UDP-N-acetylglucosamine 1-carboxyvinyltransferase [Candidatus Acetothermia bacterium]